MTGAGGLVAVAVAAQALAAAPEAACDPRLKWEDAIHSSDRFHDPDVDISMRRYTDAMRFDFMGPDRRPKGEIALHGGPVLLYGTNKPLLSDIPAVQWPKPLWYVMQRYARPCAVPAEERFRYRVDDARVWGTGLVEVHGLVRRQGRDIEWELTVEPVAKSSGPVFRASGRRTLGTPGPIPQDLAVRGWKPVKGMRTLPADQWRVDESASYATIAEARRGRHE
jgi:hypothetical protein